MLLLDGSVLVAGSNPNEMPVVEEDDRSSSESDGGNFFPTEFRTERYFPLYFSSGSGSDSSDFDSRPGNVLLSTLELYSNHSEFQISFQLPSTAASASASAEEEEEEVDENENETPPKIQISLYHNGFITHSLHMNQRMVFLDFTDISSSSSSNHPTNEELDHPTNEKNLPQQKTLRVRMPPTPNLAPPGPYVVYVVVNGVPAVGQMVMVRTGTEAGEDEDEGEGGQRKKGEAGKRLFGKERRSKVRVWGVAGLVGLVGRWL